MTKLDMVQQALEVFRDGSPEKLAAYVQSKHGETIEARFIPFFLASIRDRLHLAALRKERATAPKIEPEHRAIKVNTTSDRAKEAEKLALQLIAQHGLKDWKFAFNRRKQSMGLCVYSRKTIELSIHFVERDNPWEEIRDTILHEIAHALVGPSHGHDKVWKRKCVQIGARPKACGEADMPEGKWNARCSGCGKAFHRHRKPMKEKGWFCRDCGPEQGRLAWREAG
jgi:predicted SprT family Zn-dependent metalloprotease